MVEPEHWLRNKLNLKRLWTCAKLNMIRDALPKVTEEGERLMAIEKVYLHRHR